MIRIQAWSGFGFFFLIPDADPWSKDRIPDPDQQHITMKFLMQNVLVVAKVICTNQHLYIRYVRYCDFFVWYKVLILFLTQFCEPAHYFVRCVVSHAYTNIADKIFLRILQVLVPGNREKLAARLCTVYPGYSACSHPSQLAIVLTCRYLSILRPCLLRAMLTLFQHAK